MTRKDFLQMAGRTTILTGMAAMVGLFWTQKKLTVSGGCPTNLACSGCSKLTSCALPEAIKEKEKENDPSHGIIDKRS